PAILQQRKAVTAFETSSTSTNCRGRGYTTPSRLRQPDQSDTARLGVKSAPDVGENGDLRPFGRRDLGPTRYSARSTVPNFPTSPRRLRSLPAARKSATGYRLLVNAFPIRTC